MPEAINIFAECEKCYNTWKSFMDTKAEKRPFDGTMVWWWSCPVCGQDYFKRMDTVIEIK